VFNTIDPLIPADDGRFVSERFERLARVIQDYDPQFELRWIPYDQRTSETQKPYVVWDTFTNSAVLFAGELDSPESILARLFDGDSKHGDVLKRLDAHNAAVRALEMKRQMDLAEEKKDFVAFVAANNKSYLQLGKNRKVDDQLRPVR